MSPATRTRPVRGSSIVRKVYPDDADHIIRWLAHRVQHPDEKINHALVLGGPQGIGKDTLLEPVKYAVGPWNFREVSPKQVMGRFNNFLKSVILRISEARDLGEFDRYAFYDHMKAYTAAPPDVLRVDEKHLREYSVFNVCGVIITTNHKTTASTWRPTTAAITWLGSDRKKEEFARRTGTSSGAGIARAARSTSPPISPSSTSAISMPRRRRRRQPRSMPSWLPAGPTRRRSSRTCSTRWGTRTR